MAYLRQGKLAQAEPLLAAGSSSATACWGGGRHHRWRSATSLPPYTGPGTVRRRRAALRPGGHRQPPCDRRREPIYAGHRIQPGQRAIRAGPVRRGGGQLHARPRRLAGIAYRRRSGDADPAQPRESNLALGKLDRSEQFLTEALAGFRRIRKEGHPDILNSLSFLAAVREEQGRLAEAEALCVQVLADRRSHGHGPADLAGG